ncbi:MAG TPA: bifunctional glutamate N-acetyltransferase/amino-acid acetyltransferase ArgJ [Clostridiaceae bacterium]|nr:bifunctional glutamate N-acetyltransferase/amino-acid acetyltransferase ArgJ [Clostridiaceae bacterium]
MRVIEGGGVTYPEGFFATGVACGIKQNGKKDLAIVCSEDSAAVAGVFTTNAVKGHSLQVTMEHIKNGYASAVIINSGNANACVGEEGYKNAKEMARYASELLECSPEEILIGSTGVIGVPLNMEAVLTGIDEAVSGMEPDGGHDAVEAIMTTDTIPKEIAVEFEIQGVKVVIGGMAKGSGMIHPNMATMIGIITTDVNISRKLLEKALKDVVKRTFNRISVDGDTSVCDMVLALANGLADNPGIVAEDKDYDEFKKALEFVCTYLARLIAKDGEGATKLIEIIAEGASSEDDAYKVVSAVAKSPLVKTAIFGEDANWGRIITAVGYSGANIDPQKIDINIGDIAVCRNGAAVPFDEEEASKTLARDEIKIYIKLNNGEFSDRMWTCDFSYDYVKINGSYRS